MNADDGENFASRWSRRKIEARKTEQKPAGPNPDDAPAPQAVTAANAPGAPAADAEPPLPPVESLKGLASDYTGFLKPGVDDNLRRSALKKLFSDPHFENFERFEAYCEDFTKGESIPLAMLKTLEHAKGLLFDDEEKKETPKKVPLVAQEPAAQPLPEPGNSEPQHAAEAPPLSPAEPDNKA
jgi:hypothetical protein